MTISDIKSTLYIKALEEGGIGMTPQSLQKDELFCRYWIRKILVKEREETNQPSKTILMEKQPQSPPSSPNLVSRAYSQKFMEDRDDSDEDEDGFGGNRRWRGRLEHDLLRSPIPLHHPATSPSKLNTPPKSSCGSGESDTTSAFSQDARNSWGRWELIHPFILNERRLDELISTNTHIIDISIEFPSVREPLVPIAPPTTPVLLIPEHVLEEDVDMEEEKENIAPRLQTSSNRLTEESSCTFQTPPVNNKIINDQNSHNVALYPPSPPPAYIPCMREKSILKERNGESQTPLNLFPVQNVVKNSNIISNSIFQKSELSNVVNTLLISEKSDEFSPYSDHPLIYPRDVVLMACKGGSLGEVSSPPKTPKPPQDVFIPPNKFFVKGMRVDARDSYSRWYEAIIRDVKPDSVLIHYLGWRSKWDEWVSKTSGRILPLHALTREWREQLDQGSSLEVKVDSKWYEGFVWKIHPSDSKILFVKTRFHVDDIIDCYRWSDNVCERGTHIANTVYSKVPSSPCQFADATNSSSSFISLNICLLD